MIDLHSHILPGIDDGAESIEISLEMARAWVADGVSVVACTPHITPGVYANHGPQIRAAVAALQHELDVNGIALRLVTGADNHVMPNMAAELRSGRLLTLADSRYVLVEPPHHIPPQRLEDLFFNLLVAGYVPILTHPERLTWIKSHYATMQRLVHGGVWMQITSGSLTGSFGSAPKYWAEKMLNEGLVHILATDAHNVRKRPPDLSKGWALAAKRVGDAEAEQMVLTRPWGILSNESPANLATPVAVEGHRDESGNAAYTDDRRGRRTDADFDAHAAGGGGIGSRLRRLFGG